MTTTTTDELALAVFVDPEQLKQDIAIDLTNISGGMQAQAGLYVHYASLAVKARRQYERMERMLEILEASLDAHYRKTLVTTEEEEKAGRGGNVTTLIKTVKPTEAQVKAAISADPRHKKVSSLVIDAKQIWKLAEVAERSFDHRKDMLLQIARDAAREQGGQVRVAANTANRERVAQAMASVGKQGANPPWEDAA